jgi:uncharacterized repeat protein (TIGR03803 family)
MTRKKCLKLLVTAGSGVVLAAILFSQNGFSQEKAVSPSATQFKVLYQFTGNPDGSAPRGALVRNSAGTIYGTTWSGGTDNAGTVYKLDRRGKESVIHSLIAPPQGYNEGTNPAAGVTPDGNGNLFGTTYSGGDTPFWGTLFKVDPSGQLTVLGNFDGDIGGPFDGGCSSTHLLRDAEGNFYGGTEVGGEQFCPLNGCGVIFELNAAGLYSVLHYFTGVPDGWAPNDLLRDPQGNIFGTTQAGGMEGSCSLGSCGTIYKLDTAGNETILYSFTGGIDGGSPHAGLIWDAQGNLYGTTYAGGTYGLGVIYKLDQTGKLTVLHTFRGSPDGANPHGRLLWGLDGKLYGTALYGGKYGYGFVFQLAQNGKFVVLHNFTGGSDGAYPYAGLIRGPGSVMYGTASAGGFTGGTCGTTGCGTVYSIQP